MNGNAPDADQRGLMRKLCPPTILSMENTNFAISSYQFVAGSPTPTGGLVGVPKSLKFPEKFSREKSAIVGDE